MRIGDQLILLRKILSFAAIAKTGNVTAAALENGMKQSNLSGYVKELEEKVGAKLFEHGDRRMILTEVGKNLYEISCSIEKSVYKINSYKQQNNNVSGAVRLWTSDGLAAAYLSSCLPGFYQLYPDVKIEIFAFPVRRTGQNGKIGVFGNRAGAYFPGRVLFLELRQVFQVQIRRQTEFDASARFGIYGFFQFPEALLKLFGQPADFQSPRCRDYALIAALQQKNARRLLKIGYQMAQISLFYSVFFGGF